jgi:endonuclease III
MKASMGNVDEGIIQCRMQDFASRLAAWQRRHGRRGLPWQGTRDPYRIWLAEVMLQQTQVAAVIPYYERFLARFPDVAALAAASQEEVLQLWSGLGYYARGRNLHAAAKAIAAPGSFPRSPEKIQALPGVGRSTAAAIAVFAFGRCEAILDGNAKRVFARCFGEESASRLWELAERLLPRRHPRLHPGPDGPRRNGARVPIRRASAARSRAAGRRGARDASRSCLHRAGDASCRSEATWLVLVSGAQSCSSGARRAGFGAGCGRSRN